VNAFEDQMTQHQVRWRRTNVASANWGWQNDRQYEWILPHDSWEEGLWPAIRSGAVHSLPDYLRNNQIQKHLGVHNLKSSWMLCANLYFPFGGSDDGRALLAGFLRSRVHPDIQSADAVELEYAEAGDLHPSLLLGEQGGNRGAGQTSPDVAFLVNGGRGLILTENKFVEHSFYRCSARVRDGSIARPGNPDPARCNSVSAVLRDPVRQCHQAAWGRKYWDILAPVVDRDRLLALNHCPAAYAGYQLFRQQALAEGIAASGKYELVASCLAVDDRNETLRGCLKKTGVNDIRQWGDLYDGRARFAVFTHQQWVSWVRAHGDRERWIGWLNYVEARYGFGPGAPGSRAGDAEQFISMKV
jgi:hypothetical protein